ncbi:hypothetical protein BC829DRAFT_275275 [Chytridium lagenaria]|nr:hypothetical protein BC829DRAFT_275275 [Chytridium lagenaria]
MAMNPSQRPSFEIVSRRLDNFVAEAAMYGGNGSITSDRTSSNGFNSNASSRQALVPSLRTDSNPGLNSFSSNFNIHQSVMPSPSLPTDSNAGSNSFTSNFNIHQSVMPASAASSYYGSNTRSVMSSSSNYQSNLSAGGIQPPARFHSSGGSSDGAKSLYLPPSNPPLSSHDPKIVGSASMPAYTYPNQPDYAKPPAEYMNQAHAVTPQSSMPYGNQQAYPASMSNPSKNSQDMALLAPQGQVVFVTNPGDGGAAKAAANQAKRKRLWMIWGIVGGVIVAIIVIAAVVRAVTPKNTTETTGRPPLATTTSKTTLSTTALKTSVSTRRITSAAVRTTTSTSSPPIETSTPALSQFRAPTGCLETIRDSVALQSLPCDPTSTQIFRLIRSVGVNIQHPRTGLCLILDNVNQIRLDSCTSPLALFYSSARDQIYTEDDSGIPTASALCITHTLGTVSCRQTSNTRWTFIE